MNAYLNIEKEEEEIVNEEKEEGLIFNNVPTPKTKTTKPEGIVPSSVMVCRAIQGKESGQLLRILFDSGSTNTLINSNCLPNGATPSLMGESLNCNTAAGPLKVNREVYLEHIMLPEFDRSTSIDVQKAVVFDAPCRYDVIFGADFLSKAGIDTKFSTGTVEWMEKSVPMKEPRFWESAENVYFALSDGSDEEDDDDDFYDECEAYDMYLNTIKDAKYEKVTPEMVAEQQEHLSKDQQKDLCRVLSKYPELFDGGLGKYPHKQVHLEVDEKVKPTHSKPYPVAKAHEEVFKKELQHLVKVGVLRACGPTEWASPTFITPKKDGRVRWVSDFRSLNKALKRKIYPLPMTQDIFKRRSGYKYFTKLDLSMMYYAFELDEESKELCTIVTPYGKFQYCRLAMGLKVSPDIAQALIEETLHDLGVDVYIDDVGIFSDDWNNHMVAVSAVLKRLEENGFKVNPLKCEWAVEETDFLGHWMTPTGIKPWKKKVDAILKLLPPKNLTQLRSFLGAITYYRDMWPRRSHVLTPLTNLTGKVNYEWTPECQKAFDEIKSIIAAEVLLAYPNPNLPFEIYTDASDYQLGAVITQQGKVVANWSRKLNAAQKNYSTMEKEMLAVVLCFKEFRSMLLGGKITVFTDHKNLTFKTLNTQRVLRWRLFLEEFGPEFKYIEGKDNVLADFFSRFPRMDKSISVGKRNVDLKGKLVDFCLMPVEYSEEDENLDDRLGPELSSLFCSISDPELVDCFLNYPALHQMQYPLNYQNIQAGQFNDVQLQNERNKDPQRFPVRFVSGVPLICWRSHLQAPPGDWKIALPSVLIPDIVEWYHKVLGHVGINKLYETIHMHCHHPQLKRIVERHHCDICKRNKLWGQGYGHLPPRNAPLVPWDEVAVDLIGPWKIQVRNQEVEFNALTAIDTVSNLVELTRIDSKDSAHVQQKFANCWLSRCPRPNKCIHDKGGEFIGEPFQTLLAQAGIRDATATTKNPQANAICERMHQTVANIIRTSLRANPPLNMQQAQSIVDDALATTMQGLRCATSRVLGISPGALVFQRDMFLDLPIVADLVATRDKRQVIVDDNLRRQNLKRRFFDYTVGQQVMIKYYNPTKLGERSFGPFPVTQVHVNGNVTVRRAPHVFERINIRRILPYRLPRQV